MAKKKYEHAGQPTKYRPEYCDMLLTHMEDGLSFEAFAATLRVSKQTLYRWIDAHAEFSDAKKIGDMLSLKYWEKVGKDGLYNETIKGDDGLTVTKSINATIWIFNMKNRFGWRDRQEIDATVKHENEDSETLKTLVALLNEVKAVE